MDDSFPSKKTHAFAKRESDDCWNRSKAPNITPLKKMQLIYKAHPLTVQNFQDIDGCGLKITWSSKYDAWAICDLGGFITLIDEGDIESIFLPAVRREGVCKGAFREEITGTSPFANPISNPNKRHPFQFTPSIWSLKKLEEMLASANRIAENTTIPPKMREKMNAVKAEIVKKRAEAEAKAQEQTKPTRTKKKKAPLGISLADLKLDISFN